MSSEETIPLSAIRVITPWSRAEHNLLWPDHRVILKGFFGLPPGVVVDAVKIGPFSFTEMGAFQRGVMRAQPLVVSFSNNSPDPKSLASASLLIDKFDARPLPPMPKVIDPVHAQFFEAKAKEEERKEGETLLKFLLLFGRGEARVGFRVKELSTIEEIGAEGATLERAIILQTQFSGKALESLPGMIIPPDTPIDLVFTPKGTMRARAFCRLQKALFPPAPPFGGGK